MKNTTVVIIEIAIMESMEITIKVMPGSIKFDLSLVGAKSSFVTYLSTSKI